MLETQSSLAVAPETYLKNRQEHDVQSLGSLIHSDQKGDDLWFNLDQPKQEKQPYQLRCQYWRRDILRLSLLRPNLPERKSRAVIAELEPSETQKIWRPKGPQWAQQDWIIQAQGTSLSLHHKDFNLALSEFLIGQSEQRAIPSLFTFIDDDCGSLPIYGLGEKTGYLDKNGRKWSMWNSDVFAPHTPDITELYQSIPFYIAKTPQGFYGLFLDNTGRSEFDFSDRRIVSCETGHLDLYVFAGPTLNKVIEQFTWLTGRPALPPKWALGYHQSRHSYESTDEVRAVTDQFEHLEIPVDAIFLDILYMDEYRVFTTNPETYGDLAQLSKQLEVLGKKLVPIVDPGVKVDKDFPVYQEGYNNQYFCQLPNGQQFTGEVWPGDSAFPDFSQDVVKQWWGEQHRFFTDIGIEGIWNDMNEPSVFCDTKTMDLTVQHDPLGEKISHQDFHNAYGLEMSAATYDAIKDQTQKRPFVLTRAGYAGIQRSATVWTGDNRSFWEHLHLCVPMCLNLGLSGVVHSGPDVGGFMNDSDGELLTRWTQLGAFLPYFRNHCAIGLARQEPWSFGAPYTDIIRDFIRLRYELMPTIYQLAHQAHKDGTPIMRPLVWHYPDDSRAAKVHDQFLLGENILVAPIMEPAKEVRDVYLPAGKWCDAYTGDVFQGGQHILARGPLERIPVFLRQGGYYLSTDWKLSAHTPDRRWWLSLIDTEQSEFTLVDDDGSSFDYESGKQFELSVKIERNSDRVDVKVELVNDQFKPSWQVLELRMPETWKGFCVRVEAPDCLEIRTRFNGFTFQAPNSSTKSDWPFDL